MILTLYTTNKGIFKCISTLFSHNTGYFLLQVYKALQDKCLGDLDSGMDQVIENLKPSNIQIEQSSIATSNSLSIIESVNGTDVGSPAQEEERVADAFSVLSRYFETLSSQLQVPICNLIFDMHLYYISI